MKVKYRIWIAIGIAAILVAVGVRLLFVEAAFKYGLILIGAVAFGFLIWKAFVQGGQKELRESEEKREALLHQVEELTRKLDEVTHSPLNVTSLTPVLHLSVLNIDTSFTRTYKRDDPERGLGFEGALRADIQAEYGIRLEDVRFRFDEKSDTLYLTDFHPGLLSFSKKQFSWDLARSWHKRTFLWKALAPASDTAAEAFTREMKEQIRADVEKEIDARRIEEFEWLSPVVSRQVTDVLRASTGRPNTKVVVIEAPEDAAGFLPLDEFYQRVKTGALLRESTPESQG